MRWESNITA